MSELKKLPIGIQTFETIITDNYLYVDKTKYLHELITSGKVYFFARPRRFGKSLTISTLQAIFEGKRELFKNLAIDDLDYNWKKYPIIRLDMSLASGKDRKDVAHNLVEMLKTFVLKHKLDIEPTTPSNFLARIVAQIQSKHQQKVVILIDEYDKPILDVIEKDKNIIDGVREEIRFFYTILKTLDPSLQFLFLTGVSQFAKTSIFSGLNQLKNISHIKQGQALCGYTDEEIDLYFQEYCKRMSQDNPELGNIREKLQNWYDGYTFYPSGPKLYNPFSVLNALDIQEFNNFWFSTGTPTFLINLLKKHHFGIQNLDTMEVDIDELQELKIEQPQWMTLLHQTGYATIDHYNSLSKICKLRIPNQEVHASLFNRLLNGYIGNESYNLVRPITGHIYRALVNNNLPLTFEHLKTIFAKIPYEVSIPLEAYYQTIFYTSLLLSGLQVVVEETTNDGRIDCVVTTPTHRYIIEMKLNKPLEETFEQMRKKEYTKKYADDTRTLVEVGVIFDSKRRTISQWGHYPL